MAYCINCGNQLNPGDAFCVECGTPVDGFTTTEDPIAGGDANAAFAGQTQAMPEAIPGQTYDTPNAYAGQQQVGTQQYAQQYGSPYQAAQVGYAGAQGTKTAKSPTMAIGIAAAVVAILAIAAIAFFLLREPVTEMYRVTYETAGGSAVAASQVQAGEQITSPAEPTKDGYVFEGWYTDRDCTEKASFPITADGNIVLYAKWEKASASAESTTATGSSNNSSGSTTIAIPTDRSSSSASSKPTDKPSTNDGYDTVTISVVGANGDQRNERIRRKGTSQRVIPDSNTRYISESEARNLTDAERCVAWNEIIAASNGYVFKNGGLRNYFNGCVWYKPNPNADASGNISGAAAANVELLKSMTNDWWFNLATY